MVYSSTLDKSSAMLESAQFHSPGTNTVCLALCRFLHVSANTQYPCKQILFVLSQYKYCFGKIIIKRQDKVDVSIHQYKTHNCTVGREIHSSLMFLFFLASALRPRMWCGEQLKGDHQPAPIGPDVTMKETDRHTHTETVLQGN